MSLVTFRANGDAVPTPIWFAQVDSALYVRTASHFKKLERIANNPRVEVAPCTATGEVTGDSVPALARILGSNDPVIAGADAALEARYSLERPAMTRLRTPVRSRERQCPLFCLYRARPRVQNGPLKFLSAPSASRGGDEKAGSLTQVQARGWGGWSVN